MEIRTDFKHRMAAHCETGTLTGLLSNAGFEISEPMVFGIAGGIFFGYFESKRFAFPTFIVRSRPGEVRENISKSLKIKFIKQKFKDADKAMRALDKVLEQGKPVGTQVDLFYMSYLPKWILAHNNAHFINIVGKQDKQYIISDSYHSKIANLGYDTLKTARSAGGYMAPKNFMYYMPDSIPPIDLRKPVIKGIKKASRNMLSLPVPFIGVKGIYKFAKKVNDWPKLARDIEHLSHEIMKINVFLEDQGTGGAGFRYMYATFLKQAGELLESDALNQQSERMMKIGDDWRNISYFSAKIGKNRDLGSERISELSELIRKQGDAEKAFFTDLKTISKDLK